MVKLSIIVPVYNVEKYIRACLESIFKQGLNDEDFEVIIVNDGTTDRSMEVIQDIISLHKNVSIINQENQGLSTARNNGITAAKGEYILMPDPDDLLIENSLKPLLGKALETKADLIVADFLRMTNEEVNNLQTIPQKDFSIQEKTGEQLFLEDLNPHECYVWRTLYRRDFIINSNIIFYPGIKYQDVPFTHECYLKAEKCLKANWLLNIYRKRPGAVTYSFDGNKAFDFCIAIAKTWSLTNLTEPNTETDFKLRENVWTSFSVLIRQLYYEINNISERFQIIDFLMKEAPNLKFQNGKRQQFVTFLIRNIPHTFILLQHFYIVFIENRLLPLYHHTLGKWLRSFF